MTTTLSGGEKDGTALVPISGSSQAAKALPEKSERAPRLGSGAPFFMGGVYLEVPKTFA